MAGAIASVYDSAKVKLVNTVRNELATVSRIVPGPIMFDARRKP